MSQGLLPYQVEVVERADTVTGRAGLPLVLETLRALGLEPVIRAQVRVRERQSGYSEVEKSEALVLLLAAGGASFDNGAVLQADGGLRRLLGRRFPSADALRHFLSPRRRPHPAVQAAVCLSASRVALRTAPRCASPLSADASRSSLTLCAASAWAGRRRLGLSEPGLPGTARTLPLD